MAVRISKLLIVFIAFVAWSCGGESEENIDTNDGDSVTVIVSHEIQLEGEKLFKENCASCHAPNKDLVGPSLACIGERRDREWLYSWIRNSMDMINSGDSIAVGLYEEWGKTMQTPFEQLTEPEMDSIIFYLDTFCEE